MRGYPEDTERKLCGYLVKLADQDVSSSIVLRSPSTVLLDAYATLSLGFRIFMSQMIYRRWHMPSSGIGSTAIKEYLTGLQLGETIAASAP